MFHEKKKIVKNLGVSWKEEREISPKYYDK